MNRILVLVLLMSLGRFSRAQPSVYSAADTVNPLTWGKIRVAVMAGYTHSHFRGSDLAYLFADRKTNWLPGFHIGLAIHQPLIENFGLRHELIFSQRGAKVGLVDSLQGRYSSSLKAYYLDLYPLSLTYQQAGFQAFIGPYLSVLSRATFQRMGENGKLKTDQSVFGSAGNREGEKEQKYLQKLDFGFAVGLEYYFSKAFSLGLRYQHGFADIFQYANSYTNGDAKVDNIRIFNRSVMLSMGYVFSNGR